jgi:hypothetical protein
MCGLWCGCRRASTKQSQLSMCGSHRIYVRTINWRTSRARQLLYDVKTHSGAARLRLRKRARIFAPGCANVFWNGRWLFNWVCTIIESDVSMVMWRQFTNFIKLTLIIRHLETLSLWVGANILFSQMLLEVDLIKLIITIPRMLGRVWNLLQIYIPCLTSGYEQLNHKILIVNWQSFCSNNEFSWYRKFSFLKGN